PPAGFIGGGFAGAAHPVVGSPTGNNIFRIDGPNVGGPGVNFVETNLFNVEGQLAPGVSAFPTTLAFGDAAAGGAATLAQSVTLSNSTAAAVPITAVTLGGANPADFKLPGTGTCGASVPAHGSCTIAVTFNPAVGSL